MENIFDDPDFWAYGPYSRSGGKWGFVTRDGRVYVVAKAKDGRLFTWIGGQFVEFEDEFTAWVRDCRDEF